MLRPVVEYFLVLASELQGNVTIGEFVREDDVPIMFP